MQTKLISVLALGVAGISSVALATEPVVSSAPMQRFADDAEIDGTSILTRTSHGASFALNTRQLRRSAPYTVWWVVFNHPEQCESACACGAADLGNPAVEPGQYWATGRMSDRYGQAAYVAATGVGELPEGEGQVPHPVAVYPLDHRRDAEIHLVIRGHGPRIAGEREAQLSSLNGGCPPNECTNVQFSIHPSPTCKGN